MEAVADGMATMPDGEVDLYATAAYVSNYLGRSFPMVDRQDIYQEVAAWIASHEDKIAEYLELGKLGQNKLSKSMRHAALRYCQKEKAAHLGYETRDLYYYELSLIKNTLPLIWDDEAWVNPPSPVEEAKVKHRAPNEGNNYATTLADVSRAVSKLPTADKEMLRLLYEDGATIKEVAEILDLTVSATNSRLNRSIRKIQTVLGGAYPSNE